MVLIDGQQNKQTGRKSFNLSTRFLPSCLLMVTTLPSAAPSLLACLMLMSVTSAKSHNGCSSCAQRALPPSEKKQNRERRRATGWAIERPTHLVRVFECFPTPLDAAVGRHQDDEWSTRCFPHLEGLGVKGLLQGLHAEEVLELEVAGRGAALAELLDEALEAEADALTRQEVAFLDLSPHVLRQEGLVAGGRGWGGGAGDKWQGAYFFKGVSQFLSFEWNGSLFNQKDK